MRDVDLPTLASARADGAMVINLSGHVSGAQLIPMGQLASRLAEIPRNVPVYVICASGNRSSRMTNFLVADRCVTGSGRTGRGGGRRRPGKSHPLAASGATPPASTMPTRVVPERKRARAHSHLVSAEAEAGREIRGVGEVLPLDRTGARKIRVTPAQRTRDTDR